MRESHPGCINEGEAQAFLSRHTVDGGARAVLAHVERCTSCRRIVGAVARNRVAAAGAVDSPRALDPGERLGARYEIVRLLARGGMGEVYEARDLLLDELVALKTIMLTALDSGEALAALKAEVQLARKVSHRNVCRILEFGVHHHREAPVPFFTMELLRGETLRGRLRRGACDLTQAKAIVLQVMDGLEAIHRAGIVHRDIKPENIFLLYEGGQSLRVVVMDFGLARPLNLPDSLASSPLDRVTGTLEYMAPEQLRGATATPALDVYALGIIMFEMLAGVRPFGQTRAGPSPGVFRRLDEPAPALSSALAGADRRWEEVTGGCLATYPSARYGDVAAARTALSATGLPATTARPGNRKRLWATGLLIWGLTVVSALLIARRLTSPAASPAAAAAPVAITTPAPAPESCASIAEPSTAFVPAIIDGQR